MTLTNAGDRAARTTRTAAAPAGAPAPGRGTWIARAGVRTADVLLAVVLALAAFGLVQLVTQPTSALFARVAIDDALYFVMPAHHLWQGHGFAFDGLHRSSGVQPLWAAIVILLAGVFRDSETCVRAACGTSGALWLASSAVLYLALRPRAAGAALLVAVGWAITGMRDVLGAKGMENGVNAFVLSLLVAAAARAHRPATAGVAPYARLGVLAALFALARTENALLVAVLGAAIWCGFVPMAHGEGARWRWRRALVFALPSIVAVGACTAFFKAYFDTVMPVSGTVKLHYEKLWGGAGLRGGVLGSLLWHVDAVTKQAWATVADLVQRAAPALAREHATRGLLALVAGGTVFACVRWARAARNDATAGLALAGVAFAVLHLALMALTLPHFTEYGTWYFTSEYMLAWLVLAGTLVALLRAVRAPRAVSASLCAGLALALAAGEAKHLVRPPAADFEAVQVLHMAGRWMNEHLPAGRRIGTLSSGYVSQAAPAHVVYNLDGLMADREYVDDYLRAGRLPEYLRREGIEYFADYQPLAAWRDGLTWAGHVPLAEMRLVRWWRMDASLAYCVFALQPRHASAPADRVCQVQFEAEVLGQHRVLSEDELPSLPPRHRIATSIPLYFARSVRHVVVPEDAAPALGFTPENVHPRRRTTATFGGAVRLLGVDLPDHPVRPGSRLLLSRYWQMVRPISDGGPVSFETWVHPADPRAHAATPEHERLVAMGKPCHGTLDPRDGRAGEVVVDTYALGVPASLPVGVYPVWIGLRDGDGRWLSLGSAGDAKETDPVLTFVGNVEIRR